MLLKKPVSVAMAVLFVLLALFGSACAGGEPTPEPTPTATAVSIPPSTITEVSGGVYVLRPGADSWVDATEGMDLEVGDSLKTRHDGYAVVVFFEGSVIEVYESTRISVVELGETEAGSTTVNLAQEVGDTVHRVEQLADSASSYEVETPAGVAVVRGTWFDLSVSGLGVTNLTVEEDEACFRAQGEEECATAGFQITTFPGSPPMAAKSTARPEPGLPPGGGFPDLTLPTLPSAPAIWIELTWDTAGTDLDSHFIMPGGSYGSVPDDCHWVNPNPDWDGVGGSGTVGDPSLDGDDTDGYGPENIVLWQPPFAGSYEYKVKFLDYCAATTNCTVDIWVNGVLAATYNYTFVCGGAAGPGGQKGTRFGPSVWSCGCVDWPSGTVTPGDCPIPTPTPSPTPSPTASSTAEPMLW